MLLSSQEKKNIKNTIVENLNFYTIENKFKYFFLRNKIIEESFYHGNDHIQIHYSTYKHESSYTGFNLYFFPIETLFSYPEKLKEICNKYKFDIEIIISIKKNIFSLPATNDKFDLDNLGDGSYPFSLCSMTFKNFDAKQEIDNDDWLYAILNNVNELLLSNIQKKIFIYRSQPLKHRNVETEFVKNDQSKFISEDKIVYNLYGFNVPSIHCFHIDIVEESVHNNLEETIDFIAMYRIPNLEPYTQSYNYDQMKYRYFRKRNILMKIGIVSK